jgi:drug/metabolite transporter (DMT)-like permease
VQITMIGWGLLQGERPGAVEWVGLAIAIAGLVWLTAPGRLAPDPVGALSMGLAGVSWGVYSMRGRGPAHPLGATADNFLRSVVPAGVAVALGVRSLNLSLAGLALAVTSGAVASGLGYTLWYAALPRMTAVRAAAAQLSVPVIAGVGAVFLLGEHVTTRMVGAGLVILLGVTMALFGRDLLRRWR